MNKAKRVDFAHLFTQRAGIISVVSNAISWATQHFIATKEAKTLSLQALVELLKRYGKSFKMVTSDTGSCFRKHARILIKLTSFSIFPKGSLVEILLQFY